MKIVEIIPSLSSGGAERFVVDLSNSLNESNNEVFLIVLRKLDSQHSLYLSELDPRIRVISLNKGSGISFKALIKIIMLLMQIKPDVVHAHLNSIYYIFLPALLGLKRIAFFYTVHNDADKDAGNRLFGFFMRWIFKKSIIKPITISNSSNRSFINYYGFDAFATIYNGRIKKNIEVSERTEEIIANCRRTPNTIVLLYVARLTEQKRPLLHAKICKDLYLAGYDISLIMLGEDRSGGYYTREIENMKSECVHLLGVVSNPIEYMKGCDAFLLLSSYEGLPIALIESLSVGCVPICTPVGGVNDVIDSGVNGLLAEGCSEELCYKAVKRFLDSSQEDKEAMAEAALKSYIPLSMETCCEMYLSAFQRLDNNR